VCRKALTTEVEIVEELKYEVMGLVEFVLMVDV
jgi:hypothetical protein